MTILEASTTEVWRWARQVDRVWLTIGAGLGLGAIVMPGQAVASVVFALESFASMAPYFIAAIALAAATRASGADSLIAAAFRGKAIFAVVAAALFGAVSPFCSCGVIPVIAALLAMGVPLPPVMAFWLASPIMDPEMFVLTAGALGLTFAMVKTAAAMSIGLFGGFATWGVQRLGYFTAPLSDTGGCASCGGPNVAGDGAPVWRFWAQPERRELFLREAWSTTRFLAKWLALAFLLESLMVAYVPAETVAAMLGGDSIWAVPLAVVVGVPSYLNGYAAIPLVAGLIDLGMAPGAGLAFMTAGAITSIPAAIAVFVLVRRPVFFWYLALAVVASVLVGVTYQAVLA